MLTCQGRPNAGDLKKGKRIDKRKINSETTISGMLGFHSLTDRTNA
ncbi:hypothetical protein RRG08_015637 [Elysia crispata]|uniref:Uncharacterized protein n=1 Tax=Elysia crispata TaxID=231223 RepID=A0AAE0Y7H3_9GAST|nr:hypothetical protein RRG08_015637 [Elysia crispata]